MLINVAEFYFDILVSNKNFLNTEKLAKKVKKSAKIGEIRRFKKREDFTKKEIREDLVKNEKSSLKKRRYGKPE